MVKLGQSKLEQLEKELAKESNKNKKEKIRMQAKLEREREK